MFENIRNIGFQTQKHQRVLCVDRRKLGATAIQLLLISRPKLRCVFGHVGDLFNCVCVSFIEQNVSKQETTETPLQRTLLPNLKNDMSKQFDDTGCQTFAFKGVSGIVQTALFKYSGRFPRESKKRKSTNDCKYGHG